LDVDLANDSRSENGTGWVRPPAKVTFSYQLRVFLHEGIVDIDSARASQDQREFTSPAWIRESGSRKQRIIARILRISRACLERAISNTQPAGILVFDVRGLNI
jgi:hypothetical protein